MPTARRGRARLLTCAIWLVLSLGAGGAQAANYYVAPGGTSSASGSAAQPLDLATAVSSSSPARAGDTIWVRGGTYRGPIESRISGSASSPITVRAYPGERATIDGYPNGGTPLAIVGSNVVFWGLEVMSSDPSRVAGANTRAASGLDVLGANVKVINMVVHDNINGIGAWMVPDTELYGNVIYNNGVEDSDRGHGHSIYAQNNAATPKRIIDNVLLNSYSIGMQAYTQGGRIDNIYLEGNIAFNHGILSLVSGAKANFLWQGPPATNPSLISNYAYYSPGRDGRSVDITGPCLNGVIQDNYFMQGWNRFECSSATVTGNTIYGDPGNLRYYPSNLFLSSRPGGVDIFVRPNRYEAGRGNIAIFNWALQPVVSVNLSSLGLAVGSGFEIRDAQNFYGAPVAAGNYDGNLVAIRMTGLTVTPPIGGRYTPPHTAPEFGAFVVLPRATTGNPPTATFSAAATTISAGGSTTLTWSTSGATSVSISPTVGNVAASGSVTVSPTTSTTYALTATGTGGIVSQTVAVTVTYPVSADGAMSPPLTQLVDAEMNIWTLGANGRTLRNGIQVGSGYGSRLLWYGRSIYTQGTDSTWWRWNGTKWDNVGATQPGTGPTPPSTTVSPDGAMSPPLSQLVDSGAAVWTLASNGRTLRNGVHVGGGYGAKLLWFGGSIYTFSFENLWWRWNGASWEQFGASQPGTGGGTVPPVGTVSPDGSMIPQLTQLVDSSNAIWTLASDGRVLRNGVQAGGGFGTKLLWYASAIYTFGTDGNWWRWNGSAWERLGPNQPGSAGASPDGATSPSLTQLVDSSGNIWTLASDRRTLRNETWVGSGYGTKLLWKGGVIYVQGTDATWWQWQPTSSSWLRYGATQP